MLNYSEAGHGRQILAGLIDASLSSAFVITLYVFKGPELLYRTLEAVNGSLLVLMVFGFYRLLSLSFFNQTLGMRLFRLVLLNGEERPLTYLEKTMAAIFILFHGTTYYHVK